MAVCFGDCSDNILRLVCAKARTERGTRNWHTTDMTSVIGRLTGGKGSGRSMMTKGSWVWWSVATSASSSKWQARHMHWHWQTGSTRICILWRLRMQQQ